MVIKQHAANHEQHKHSKQTRSGSTAQLACSATSSSQLARPVIRLKLLAELVGPLLLDLGALLPRPAMHVLLRQPQQACSVGGVGGV